MEDIKVSVVVPVYNVEKYIDKCLDSLVPQTLKEIEIIVVNDGSPDNSQTVIDKYTAQYPEKVFSYIKTNGGLGDARNYGIDRVHGEYIGFVDSDDWVDKKMFESMYKAAKDEDDDIVICDLIEINDGWQTGHVAQGYRGNKDHFPLTKYDFMLNSLDPSFAWNKLYKRSLFYIKKFPSQWYEDMGSTPILLSYANKIGYIPYAFYYYRQVAQSITKASGDIRILKVIDSWEACLDEVKSDYLEPVELAVYRSIDTFTHFKPEFAQQFLDYAKSKKERFMKNVLISNGIKSGELENIFKKQLIPRIIHYFWFGGNPKSELVLRCIESWKKWAPDFEIIEWNESNCDMHVNRYVEEAYAAKKWAFVADYFRMEKIAEYGGLYFDTDVELMREPSQLLLNKAFFAFETRDCVHAGAFGAVPHHPVVERCRDSYKKSAFIKKDGTYDSAYTVVRRITEQLDKYGLVLDGHEQVLRTGIRIYPANKLTLDMFDGEIIAQHHYDCSWWDVKVGIVSYKNTVLRDYFGGGVQMNAEITAQRDFYKSEYERLENSTCWRITKPLRVVADFFKRILRRKAR